MLCLVFHAARSDRNPLSPLKRLCRSRPQFLSWHPAFLAFINAQGRKRISVRFSSGHSGLRDNVSPWLLPIDAAHADSARLAVDSNTSSKRLIARRLKSLELKDKIMRKDVQEALESAIAEFEKRQQAEQERLRERERFETDWARIRTALVLLHSKRSRYY